MFSDVQLAIISNLQMPDRDAVNNFIKMFCQHVSLQGNDPSLRVIQKKKRQRNHAKEAFLKAVRDLVSHGYMWDYIYDLCNGHMEARYHLSLIHI